MAMHSGSGKKTVSISDIGSLSARFATSLLPAMPGALNKIMSHSVPDGVRTISVTAILLQLVVSSAIVLEFIIRRKCKQKEQSSESEVVEALLVLHQDREWASRLSLLIHKKQANNGWAISNLTEPLCKYRAACNGKLVLALALVGGAGSSLRKITYSCMTRLAGGRGLAFFVVGVVAAAVMMVMLFSQCARIVVIHKASNKIAKFDAILTLILSLYANKTSEANLKDALIATLDFEPDLYMKNIIGSELMIVYLKLDEKSKLVLLGEIYKTALTERGELWSGIARMLHSILNTFYYVILYKALFLFGDGAAVASFVNSLVLARAGAIVYCVLLVPWVVAQLVGACLMYRRALLRNMVYLKSNILAASDALGEDNSHVAESLSAVPHHLQRYYSDLIVPMAAKDKNQMSLFVIVTESERKAVLQDAVSLVAVYGTGMLPVVVDTFVMNFNAPSGAGGGLHVASIVTGLALLFGGMAAISTMSYICLKNCNRYYDGVLACDAILRASRNSMFESAGRLVDRYLAWDNLKNAIECVVSSAEMARYELSHREWLESYFRFMTAQCCETIDGVAPWNSDQGVEYNVWLQTISDLLVAHSTANKISKARVCFLSESCHLLSSASFLSATWAVYFIPRLYDYAAPVPRYLVVPIVVILVMAALVQFACGYYTWHSTRKELAREVKEWFGDRPDGAALQLSQAMEGLHLPELLMVAPESPYLGAAQGGAAGVPPHS